ncbi:CMRF35-like molecule 8 isoform X1 [Hemibagrus wyckioides]|uniref:CMRF35-like molecule 8 isoform X1 n=1 Tax=Hemibagrus wyckioides TaxID=337641 RepID=UPI00266CF034|nr:CMRF35-like molecule 8 isoform X1 [Hemibagrus wyckioides]
MKILLIFTFFLIIAGTDAVTTVTGYRGRSVQIKCPYESGKEQNKKYLCRGECPFVGYRDIPVQSGSPPKDTRFSLYDNTTARVFIITITDLRTEDGGTYWCTINQKLAQDIYTEILLLVKTAGTDAGTTVTGYRGRSVQIKCPYESGKEQNKKYLCRDDPTISSVSHTTHFTPTHEDTTHSVTDKPLNYTTVTTLMTPSSQGFQTVPVIIAVSVVLVLLLITLLLTLVIQWRKKTQASSPAQSLKSPSNLQVLPLPVYDYEEIKDSRHVSNTLYCTTELPTILPDCSDTIYSNTELPTVPCDSSQAVYSTVQNPTDSPEQDFYSTAQLPSAVSATSPSVVKSGESPMYAAVRFETGSYGAAPTATYKNDSNSCDYATVNVT